MEHIAKIKIYPFFCFVVLIFVAYFPIFEGFASAPIRMWDEATYANNSIDMAHGDNNIFVVQQLNEPDLYNSKPPFVIWMQAIAIKIFGINEFAIRLPSAIFGLFTVFLTYFFSVRHFKSESIGLISAAILLSSKGYISNHVVRSGDLDAILVFWLMLGVFVFVDLIIRKPKNSISHYLLLSFSFIFGFLSKGVAGFFFIPCMFIISCFPNNLWIYKDVKLYIFATITLLFSALYYLIRESLAAGYLDVVLASEILRINSIVMSWHVQPFDFYYQNMKNNCFAAFFYYLPTALILPFITKSNKFNISIALLVVAVGYFLLISYPAVKLHWYDAPLYPILSILLALTFVETVFFLRKKLFLSLSENFINIALLIFASLYIYSPYKAVLKANQYDENQIYTMEFDGAYLRHLKENNIDIQQLIVLKEEKNIEHYDQVLFYIRAYNIENNRQLTLKHEVLFEEGDIVMCSQEALKIKILELYAVDTINTWQQGVLYKIKR